jgi:hypothetical protein
MNDEIIELNVGGSMFTTSLNTLLSVENSFFYENFDSKSRLFNFPRDLTNRYFLDRDGKLFYFILEYLRNKILFLPENFSEKQRFKFEAEFYKLASLIKLLDDFNLTNGSTFNDTLTLEDFQITTTATNVPATYKSSEYSKEKEQFFNLSSSLLPHKKIVNGCIIVGYRGKIKTKFSRFFYSIFFSFSLTLHLQI